MCGGEIKNTEELEMTVTSVAVRLKYGLYVVHLSKGFDFVFFTNIKSLVCRLHGLTIWQKAKSFESWRSGNLSGAVL